MSHSRMHGVCRASVGRVQPREDSLILQNPDIVLFRIARKICEIKEREVVYMDDIGKLKAENSDLRTRVNDLERNEYSLTEKLRKVSETNERLLRILENFSNGYAKKER